MTRIISSMAEGPVKYISAGDLEKYAYCPLSFLLSLQFDKHREDLDHGIEEHEKLGKTLWEIDAGEKTAREAERLVFWWAVAATLFAIVGLEVLPLDNAITISQILGVVALIWILAATFFLYKAARSNIDSMVMNYERLILVFAIVAVVVGISALAFLVTDLRLAEALEAVAIVWLIGASYFLYRSLRSTEIVDALRKEFRVKGKIEYIDMERSKVFKSEKYGLSGRPDYIIKLRNQIIPVEEKKGRTPRGPLFSHILQIAAYCLLIEETTGEAPSHGLLKYPEHEHDIEYDDDLKGVLLQKLQEMRVVMEKGDAHRNHNRPGKCLNCSRREVCPERLA